jgi:XTP/dITP diphosphohydrolase
MAISLLIASNNPGKVREIRDLLGPLGIATVTPADVGLQLEVPETGRTFGENAALKARAFAAASGHPALADDSGLEVDALGGEPGILSARYAGEGAADEDRNALILTKLHGVPGAERTARFVAVLALAHPGRDHIELFEGRVEGYIAEESRGSCGFGYDPIFYLPVTGRTFGEMDAAEKARHSHRGQAIRVFARYMQGVPARYEPDTR